MFWKAPCKEAVLDPPRGPAAGAEAVPCALLARFLGRAARLQPSPHVLMLGELCGANVTFLGERGFRVTVHSDVRPGAAYAGALVWDALSLMPPAEARRRTAALHDVLEAGGAVLAFFGPASPAGAVPRTRFRILSETHVRPEAVPGRTGLPHAYPNREILRIFERFDLDLLHTHRNGHREVLFFKSRF